MEVELWVKNDRSFVPIWMFGGFSCVFVGDAYLKVKEKRVGEIVRQVLINLSRWSRLAGSHTPPSFFV